MPLSFAFSLWTVDTHEIFSELAEKCNTIGVVNLQFKKLAMEYKMQISMCDFCSVRLITSRGMKEEICFSLPSGNNNHLILGAAAPTPSMWFLQGCQD